MNDPVNYPDHYTSHPSGVECIQITEHMGFNLGNAFKYIWRADMKAGLEDLRKATWYLQREIAKREKEASPDQHQCPVRVYPAPRGEQQLNETLHPYHPEGEPEWVTHWGC